MDPVELSRVQRVVLLVDVHPLLRLPDPALYINPVLSAARIVLSSPSLASAGPPLAAHRLLFSSLSPVLSTSRLHRLLGSHPSLLSFDRPASALLSLSRSLHSLASGSKLADPSAPSSPRASLLAATLLRLEHDYAWEPPVEDLGGMQENLITFRSNLVLLFSPIPRSLDGLLEYVDLEVGADDESFLSRFHQVFGQVNERLIARDIHLCWVDVDFDERCHDEKSSVGILERGIRELGWGFCSTDAIVLGSALVPFGLIFPFIGCSMGFKSSSSVKQVGAELVLDIADVSGKPLKCKVCDLEMLELKHVKEGSDNWVLFSRNAGSGNLKIRVREVWQANGGARFIDTSHGLVLLCGRSVKSARDKTRHSSEEFFADKVLELLCREEGLCSEQKPVWQLLLAFLYKGSYWAAVSISDGNGGSMEGILRPFAVNYALLSITEQNSQGLSQLTMPGQSDSGGPQGSGGRKKRKSMGRKQFQDFTWSSFCDAVLNEAGDSLSGLDLEEIYFTRECNRSKKLWFLNCWMRQTRKSNGCHLERSNELKEPSNINEEAKVEFASSQHEPLLQLQSSSSSEEIHPDGLLREEAMPFSCLEDIEAFIRSIPEKIDHGLCSEEVEMSFLAERLVHLCVHALLMKYGSSTKEDSVPKEANESSDMRILIKVFHLLLSKPKDLASKYKGINPASDPSLATCKMENKVREHELQILFRMEILNSRIGESIEESLKQKMVKEICSLLQNIEFNLQGDLFHGDSLVEFAGRTIKSRYADSLGDVVHKIYSQMEFFSFGGDDVEVSESLANSNSDESQRDKDDNAGGPHGATEVTVRTSSSQVISGAGISHHVPKAAAMIQKEMVDYVQEQRLMKAQEKRDRDRRFTSFTSWMPDLQRLWALKQPRADRPKSEFLLKPSKRRRQQMTSRIMVCETPMPEKKQSIEQGDHGSDKKSAFSEFNSCRSLSKALFQSEENLDVSIIP